MSTTTSSDAPTIVANRPALHLRIAYFISLWSFKAFIAFGLRARRLFRWRRYHPGQLVPEIKVYPIRRDLKNRLFKPKNSIYEEKLPLYIDVHGGGWAVMDPETDDEFCSFMAEHFGIIVISLDYHKAPSARYPCAVDDIIALTEAVLEDTSLNIDTSNVVLGGFSAGGNLAFAACQTESLRDRINGLVGLYPCLDMSESLADKLKRSGPNAPSDLLASSAMFLDWGYVPQGCDRRDPQLSPAYADPANMPKNVYLVGAEYDILCHEAEQLANKLAMASEPHSARSKLAGLAIEDAWQQGGIRWECARGMQHAFTHITKRGKAEVRRVTACRDMYERIGRWLVEDVYEF